MNKIEGPDLDVNSHEKHACWILQPIFNPKSLSNTGMSIKSEWVCFDIPFFLQLPDSFDDNVYARLYPTIDGKSAELRFKREPIESRGGKTFGMVVGDRLGNASYTKTRVGLTEPILKDIPEDETEGRYFLTSDLRDRDGYLIGESVQYLNQFLQAYRTSLEYFWIRPLTPREIVSFELVSVYENGEQETRHRKITGRSLKLPNATLGKEECGYLNGLLQDEVPIPLLDEIDLDTQDKIDLEESSLAVLNAERFFEIWLKNAFEIILRSRGWGDNEIDDLLKRDNGEYERLSNIAGNFVDHHLNFKFQDTDEYTGWLENTHKLRNEIAHEGYNANRDEAVNAYKAAIEATILLSNEFDDELSNTSLFNSDEYWERNILL